MQTFDESIANMRGGCAYNFDGTKREPADLTDLEYNINRWREKYGTDVLQDIRQLWHAFDHR